MIKIPKVLELVVNNDLCIGCGLCTYSCQSKVLEMRWNNYGFLIPELSGICVSDGSCITVCPFNPFPKNEIKTENELADLFLKDNLLYHPKIGRFIGIYSGYSNEFRLTSSSGGIATFILTELLERGIVDFVFSVKESLKEGAYYEYAVINSKEELISASKTRYFPVTLGKVMNRIHEIKGKVAIVGVACFIKAIRLAQYREPELQQKIPFLVGIICGGIKSSFFTEYLAGKAGVSHQYVQQPQYRIKDLNSSAGDYSFSCYNIKSEKVQLIKMRLVGDMWGTGLFKNNACDYCDDVTTELADISLGDAWLPPFINDGAGTNVIITRTKCAEELVLNGIKEGKINIDSLQLERFMASQQGSFNHRHTGLPFRIGQAKKLNRLVPPKRFSNSGSLTLTFQIVQIIRMKIRINSLYYWRSFREVGLFDERIKKHLRSLKMATRLNHYSKSLIALLKSKKT